jgi:iron complex outermembrane recepter protein
MSELANICSNRASVRWKLLTGASVLALTAYVSSTALAGATDAGSPLVWIEVDGQFARQNDSQDVYVPPFLPLSPFDAAMHANLENGSATVWDRGAKISYQPTGSDWIFSLGVRYGKNSRSDTINHQTPHASGTKYGQYVGGYDAYQIFNTQNSKSHIIADFQAGKDVGLGKFGSGGRSVFSAGLRFAQFNSRTNVQIQSQPTNINDYGYYHIFRANFDAQRKFTGIGPSLSWDASANIIGNSSAGSITLDWGVNGAMLFGRQRMNAHHQTTDNYKHRFYYLSVAQTSGSAARSKQVTVPNLGGFAGLSFRYVDAKVSVGYRADFFFDAMDGGIDVAKKENVGFYGPFATISVGIGG